MYHKNIYIYKKLSLWSTHIISLIKRLSIILGATLSALIADK